LEKHKNVSTTVPINAHNFFIALKTPSFVATNEVFWAPQKQSAALRNLLEKGLKSTHYFLDVP
jgi:hypothetical protein